MKIVFAPEWATVAAALVGAVPATILGIWTSVSTARNAERQRVFDADQRALDREHEARAFRSKVMERYQNVNLKLDEYHAASKSVIGAMRAAEASDAPRHAVNLQAYDTWFAAQRSLRTAITSSGDSTLADAVPVPLEAVTVFGAWAQGDANSEDFARASYRTEHDVRLRLTELFATV